MPEAAIFNPVYPDLLMDNIGGDSHAHAGNTALFERVFKAHFKSLHSYAFTIVKDEDTAEEIVQNVFYKIWEKKEKIAIESSFTAYLYRSVYYECLNVLKHDKVREAYRNHAVKNNNTHHPADDLALKELRQKIDYAINELPEQCRTVFQLSRFDGLRYKAIALRLGISEKTVENQMGKALKTLRLKLMEYLPAILLFINLENFVR